MSPLTRANLTIASRVMLPVYVLVAGYIGLCYLFSPEQRLQGPSLTVARMLLPMPVWGTLALLLSATVATALVTRRRHLAIGALCFGGVAYLAWSAFYAASIFLDPAASLVSPIWPFLAAAAHFASALSLMWREVS